MKHGRNILFDDEKRKNRRIFLLLVGGLLLIGTIGFLFMLWLDSRPEKIDTTIVDPYFERFTLKNVANFEESTTKKVIYTGDNNALGYFYKNGKITVENLTNDVKINSTLDMMLKCYFKSPELNGCGISYDEEKIQFSSPSYEVTKYMKLLYGNNITYKDKNAPMEYGRILNTEYKNSVYYFDQVKRSDFDGTINYYSQRVISNNSTENELTLIKSIAYFEGITDVEGNITGIEAYRFDNKNARLDGATINLEKFESEFLKKDTAPQYKLIFGKHSDGSYIFKSIEPIN